MSVDEEVVLDVELDEETDSVQSSVDIVVNGDSGVYLLMRCPCGPLCLTVRLSFFSTF